MDLHRIPRLIHKVPSLQIFLCTCPVWLCACYGRVISFVVNRVRDQSTGNIFIEAVYIKECFWTTCTLYRFRPAYWSQGLHSVHFWHEWPKMYLFVRMHITNVADRFCSHADTYRQWQADDKVPSMRLQVCSATWHQPHAAAFAGLRQCPLHSDSGCPCFFVDRLVTWAASMHCRFVFHAAQATNSFTIFSGTNCFIFLYRSITCRSIQAMTEWWHAPHWWMPGVFCTLTQATV
jgi:hypothetical protein